MARLGDLCRFINGDRGKNYPSQAEISSDGDVPFINAGHLVDGKLDFSDMNYIAEEKYTQLNSGKIQENDVLYCLRGSLGKKAIIKGISKGAIASSLVIIRPDARLINSDYLFYALESPTVQEQMMQANNGSSQPNLSAKSVSDYTFNLPTINEQCEIVSKLAKVNDLISLRKEQLAKLDEVVKARFVELFGGKYATKTLESVCEELFAGGDVKKDISSDIQSEEHPYPIYTNGEKNNGLYGYTSKARVTKEAVTISGRGTIGFTCLRKEPFYPAVRLIVAVPNKELVSGCYLQHFVQSKNYGGQGASIPQLTVPMIKDELIPVPPMESQNQFAAFVEQTDKSKLAIQQSLDKLETLKKSLMQKYFG